MHVANFKQMQARTRRINEANGWYDVQRTFGEDCALIHSEVSEALEEYRVLSGEPGSAPYESGMRKIGFELADIVIRTMDTAERLGLDLQWFTESKLAENERRTYRHGGKKL